MAGMAGSAQVIRIKEESLITIMLRDVQLRSDGMVNVGARCCATAEDPDLTERVAGKDEANRAHSPRCTVIELLEPD